MTALASTDNSSPSLGVVLAAFEQQQLPRRKLRPLYQLGLLLVAVTMVLLPLLYISIVALFAYGVYYHIVEHADVFDHASGTGVLLWYFGPAVIGSIGVIFMVKPLFAKRVQESRPYTLQPGQQPDLEAFVNRIADTVGAPRPKSIELSTDVNAAAGLRRGMISLFSNDLRLIVGTPLLAGLSLQQLGGVLAHEFGHFAQGAGMRLTYIIRSVNAWFARVVYERDAMDAWLEEVANSMDLRLGIVLHLARLLIWITRRILWVLMYIGHGVSCFALRQMEYDADSYEVQFAGSGAFAETSNAMQVLNLGVAQAHGLLQETWGQGRLSNEITSLILQQAGSLKEKDLKKMQEQVLNQKTKWVDTHPCDADRIRAAEALNQDGIFHLQAPAITLLQDYEMMFEDLTREFYRGVGLSVNAENLVSNDELLGQEQAMLKEYDSLEQFFGEEISIFDPVWVTPERVEAGSQVEDLALWREQHLQRMEEMAAAFKKLDRAYEQQHNLMLAMEFLRAEIRFKASVFGLEKRKKEEVVTRQEEVTRKLEQARLDTQGFRDAAADALVYGLQHASAEDQALAQTLPQLHRNLNDIWPRVLSLQQGIQKMTGLLHAAQGGEISEQHLARIRLYSTRLDRERLSLKKELERTPYPYEHAKENANLWHLAYHVPNPEQDKLIWPLESAEALIHQLFRLYQRSLGSMASFATATLPDIAENAAKEEQTSEKPALVLDS